MLGGLGSAIGLGLGILVASGLRALFKLVGFELPSNGTIVETRTIVVSLLVGTIVTLIACMAPAWRATRVPPVAALREDAVVPRSKGSRRMSYARGARRAQRRRAAGVRPVRLDELERGADVRRPRRCADVHRRRAAQPPARRADRERRRPADRADVRHHRAARAGEHRAPAGAHRGDRGGADDRGDARDVRVDLRRERQDDVQGGRRHELQGPGGHPEQRRLLVVQPRGQPRGRADPGGAERLDGALRQRQGRRREGELHRRRRQAARALQLRLEGRQRQRPAAAGRPQRRARQGLRRGQRPEGRGDAAGHDPHRATDPDRDGHPQRQGRAHRRPRRPQRARREARSASRRTTTSSSGPLPAPTSAPSRRSSTR